jgi:hypothetical protein
MAAGGASVFGDESRRTGSWEARRRRGAAIALALTGLTSTGAGIGTSALGASSPVLAQAARVLNVHDEGRLRFLKSSGSVIIDEGPATGSFPGKVHVRFTYNGEPTVSAQFTITGTHGTISARASGKLSSPASPSPSFRGTMIITGGSGRYSRVRGRGEMFGVFDRRSYGLTVQAIGKLSY